LILKVVNAGGKEQTKIIVVDGVKSLQGMAKMTVLQSNNLDAVNTLDNPLAVSPKETEILFKKKNLNLALAPYSFNVVRVKM
jgi:alpha-L-arabinofuranosidase